VRHRRPYQIPAYQSERGGVLQFHFCLCPWSESRRYRGIGFQTMRGFSGSGSRLSGPITRFRFGSMKGRARLGGRDAGAAWSHSLVQDLANCEVHDKMIKVANLTAAAWT
jgi:hypothetical protein